MVWLGEPHHDGRPHGAIASSVSVSFVSDDLFPPIHHDAFTHEGALVVGSPVHMLQVSLVAGKTSSANFDLWSSGAKMQPAAVSRLIRLASFKLVTRRTKYVSHISDMQGSYVIHFNNRRRICVAHAIGTSLALATPCIRQHSGAGVETLHHQPPNPSVMKSSTLPGINLNGTSR